ncbi:MAG TPA: cytochrome b/b6 domain-containing protein [Blastocatellia bacterium]|nr:cytochrome b/b6 domain-containing protein [Blastocatellia bacterium]
MATTKSGLMIPTIEAEIRGRREVFSREHPWLVRFTHWLNAVSLVVMIGSGLQIYMAFPSFGEKIPQEDFLHFPEAMRIGGWLGGALQWHYSFAWPFALTGIAYVGHLLISGHWRQVILLPSEISGVWPMVRHYFFFKRKPESTQPYNPLQKLAYTSTILFGVLAVVTGILLYQPARLAFAVRVLGGFGLIRIYHFAAMIGFLSFIPGHLIMVALHGWNNFYSMLTGWKKSPDYLRPELKEDSLDEPVTAGQAHDHGPDQRDPLT